MNCREVRKWMSPYLDSELGQTKTFEIGEHLAACESCAERFEAERRADELIRERIPRESMPDELWEAVTVAPAPRVSRGWFGVRSIAAVAAVIAIAVLSVTMLQTGGTPATPRVIDEYVAAAPEDLPFSGPGDSKDRSRQVNSVLRREFGLEMAMPRPGQLVGHFGFELVSAIERTDPQGRKFVEVRLNCCGKPVILAFASRDARMVPAQFQWPNPPGGQGKENVGAFHVAYRDVGGAMVVGASKHPVADILDLLFVVGT